MPCLTDLTFFACSSRIKIEDSVLCFTITYLSAVSRSASPGFPICNAMLDSIYFNTSFLEVIISCKNIHVSICDLSDLTLQIMFDVWWTSINVGSKHPIGWNHSSHASSWLFYLHCEIKETGSPGIICIVSLQVLYHPSEYATSSMGKYLLAKAHITKLNESTKSEVTQQTSCTVDKTVLAILKTQTSRGFTIVCSYRKFIFNIKVWSILPELTDKTPQTGS